MTVVFDAGKNSGDNFARLAKTGLHYVGSVPASGCGDLTALPAAARSIVDQERFGGLTAFDTRRVTYGTDLRALLTHPPQLHATPAARLDRTTPGQARRQLGGHSGH